MLLMTFYHFRRFSPNREKKQASKRSLNESELREFRVFQYHNLFFFLFEIGSPLRYIKNKHSAIAMQVIIYTLNLQPPFDMTIGKDWPRM